MKLPPGEALAVSLAFGPTDRVALGRLALDRRGVAAFEYTRAFLDAGIPAQPLWPPPAPDVLFAKEPRVFDGLHGIFADSLPDAWGFEVMRRRAALRGIAYAELSPLDRLAIVGESGAGALVFTPDYSETTSGAIDLDMLSDGALAVLDGIDTDVVEELAKLGGSSGGARPKVFIGRNESGHAIAGNTAIPVGYDAWIVKFRGRYDVADIGPLEAAYADMARAAGIDVMPTTLIASSRGPGYFATKRFDRGAANTRIHTLSVAALLEIDWNLPSIDYVALHHVVRHITSDQRAVEQMFRRMVFNVLAGNRDDHTKQHRFLMSRDGVWRLAPAYDLTPSSGPSGQHYLAVNGKGGSIESFDLLAVARAVRVKPAIARATIEDVRTAIARFPSFASAYGVSPSSIAVARAAMENTSSLT